MNVESLCKRLNFGESEEPAGGDNGSKQAEVEGNGNRSEVDVKQEQEPQEQEKEVQVPQVSPTAESAEPKIPKEKMSEAAEAESEEAALRAFLEGKSSETIESLCEDVKKDEHFPAYKQVLLQEGVDEPDEAFGSPILSDPLEDLVHWSLWIAKEKPECYKLLFARPTPDVPNDNVADADAVEAEKARARGQGSYRH